MAVGLALTGDEMKKKRTKVDAERARLEEELKHLELERQTRKRGAPKRRRINERIEHITRLLTILGVIAA